MIIYLSTLKHAGITCEVSRMCEVVVGLYCIVIKLSA